MGHVTGRRPTRHEPDECYWRGKQSWLKCLALAGYAHVRRLAMSSDDELSKEALKQTLDKLTPRERKILKERFGIDVNTDLSLEEVEKQFTITRAKIREVEKLARERPGKDDDPNDAA